MLLNECFETVQGEGHFTGTPALFIRLQGCDVGCPWCDTKYTWRTDYAPSEVAHVVAKQTESPAYAVASVNDLAELAHAHSSRHIVLTGGEPAIYDLVPLTNVLEGMGRRCQIETSGTEPIRVTQHTWVTCSPKADMPGGKTVLESALARADEIKMPVGKPHDLENLERMLRSARPDVEVWLQPISQSDKATELCRAVAARKGWRVSLQMHKAAGVR